MNTSAHRRYLFDGFTVDLARGCLMREGEELKLRPKSFKTLIYLVENAGRLISKEELIGAIWPDVAVTDDSLVQCLIEIRKALGNAQRYIKTVPRRGYIFDAKVAVNDRVLDAPKDRRQPTEVASSFVASSFSSLRGKKKALAIVAFSVAVLSAVFFVFRGQVLFDSAEFRSVAVLPFKEIGTTDNDKFLGLGMTDTLIAKLSNVKEITIRSTSAVRPYAKPEQDPVAAGEEQGVDAVLDGSIQKSGENIRVTVQLLRVKDGRMADEFDEKLSDIFTVEDSIAQRVVEALRLHVNGGEKQGLTKQYTRNVEAYLAYQFGNEYYQQHTRAGHLKAIEYYRTAIQKDPDFAQAHVALARIYFESYSPLPRAESQRQAESELRAALELDSNLGEAHALIGEMKLDEQDYSAAETELSLAREFNPTSEEVLESYWRFLLLMGKYDEAVIVGQREADLDPLSPIKKGIVPFILLRAGRCDEALERFQKVHHEYPPYVPAANNIGVAYICKGLYKEAAAQFEETVMVQQAPERESFANLAFAYAKSGRREKAQEMLRELKEESSRRYIDPVSFAIIYAGLGDTDRALDALEKVYKDRSGPPYLHLRYIALNVLQSDPRWTDFARRKGLAR